MLDAPANFQNSGNFPGGRARGLFDPKTKYYRALDVCAFNGSEWRARYDNPGLLLGAGWVLGAKGARGKPGERGPAGVHVSGIDLVGYTLVVTLSDGTTLNVNLLLMLELYEQERAAMTDPVDELTGSVSGSIARLLGLYSSSKWSKPPKCALELPRCRHITQCT